MAGVHQLVQFYIRWYRIIKPVINFYQKKNTVEGYLVAKTCLKKFIEIYLQKHNSIISAITTVLVDLKIQSQEDNQLVITDKK